MAWSISAAANRTDALNAIEAARQDVIDNAVDEQPAEVGVAFDAALAAARALADGVDGEALAVSLSGEGRGRASVNVETAQPAPVEAEE